MAPLSAYLFRLKPGYSIGTVRPKTMCRKLLREQASIEEQVSVHAHSLQDEEEKLQQNHRLQKDRERERETAKKTGQIGGLFERTTRHRTAAKPLKEHYVGPARKPREHQGGVDRGWGEGAAARPVSRSVLPALDLLGRGAVTRVERHKFLQRPVIFQGKVGSVCEAHRDATGQSGPLHAT